MQLKKEKCSRCSYFGFLANKTKRLCIKCNADRLDPGGLKKAKKVKKMLEKALKTPKIAKNRSKPAIKRKSEKKASRDKKLHETYQIISQTREHVCEGCGRFDVPLSNSHSIPVSRRRDLESDPENIGYHCLSIGEKKGCHDKWDTGDIEIMSQLLDFEKRMKYIKEHDEGFYWLLIRKAELD
jgi:hypothetical protein